MKMVFKIIICQPHSVKEKINGKIQSLLAAFDLKEPMWSPNGLEFEGKGADLEGRRDHAE